MYGYMTYLYLVTWGEYALDYFHVLFHALGLGGTDVTHLVG